jgi:hypothetical protein
MRLAALIFLVATLPVAAQEAEDAPEGDVPEGWLLEDFSEEMRKSLEGLLGEVKPELENLIDRLGVIGDYEAPEILPNGDIIIRRKRDIPAEPDPEHPIDI